MARGPGWTAAALCGLLVISVLVIDVRPVRDPAPLAEGEQAKAAIESPAEDPVEPDAEDAGEDTDESADAEDGTDGARPAAP
jgi:hypothetical protein